MEMLKKLRIKFIVIVMTIVLILISTVFAFLYLSTARNLEKDAYQMMSMASRDPLQSRRPNDQPNGMRLPYFTVYIDGYGEVTGVGGDFFDFSDSEMISELVGAVDGSGESFGILKKYNLRYLVSESKLGKIIVFTDSGTEKLTLVNLLKTSFISGSAAMLVFFAISVFLAKWIVKPVEDSWNQQKQFVADASHELKTPLTVIITDTELIREPDCTPQERDKLSFGIIEMSIQMRGLVESLLDLARVDNPEKKGAVDFSVSDALTDVALVYEPLMFEKNYSFTYSIEENIFVNGNREKIRQLAQIFLDNALKYACEGAEVVLRLTSKHSRCIIEVSNQGDPISKDDLKNIFKRFYRADKVRAMNHSYGLGLSIAQSITESHKGKIWAESNDGWNSFFVELPAFRNCTSLRTVQKH